jgi:hypothetical protein
LIKPHLGDAIWSICKLWHSIPTIEYSLHDNQKIFFDDHDTWIHGTRNIRICWMLRRKTRDALIFFLTSKYFYFSRRVLFCIIILSSKCHRIQLRHHWSL